MPVIPFSPPRIDDKIVDAVNEALRSGWITTGPRTKRFESEISRYCGADKTLCLNSWTNAVELFLRWYGIGPGDEVIVPAYTYAATGNVVLHTGAKLILADSGETALAAIESIRSCITERTKVIMPVDIGGVPFDYPGLYSLLDEPDIRSKFVAGSTWQEKMGRILVLADAAHSFGAKREGRLSGAMADVTGFSFHAVKNLSTAEGGALSFKLPSALDSDKVYSELAILGLHGQTKDALSKMQAGAWRYDIIHPGYKCNMTDIQAALGLVELERYETETLPRRRAQSLLYDMYLSGFDWAELPRHEALDYSSSWHLYMLRIKGIEESQRDAIIAECAANGVSTNVHFVPLPMFTAYRERGYRIEDSPEAYRQYANEISLPLYYDLTGEQIDTVCRVLAAAVEKVCS
jgi:dTDP-4-amino-4,6-dideoxygalactose transaminase